MPHDGGGRGDFGGRGRGYGGRGGMPMGGRGYGGGRVRVGRRQPAWHNTLTPAHNCLQR